MRKSLEDIAHIIRDIPYPKPLPSDLMELHYYLMDAGHSIMCILQCHLKEARESCSLDLFEIPVPVKYVLSKGYGFIKNQENKYVVVDALYVPDLGLVVDKSYYEY